MSETIFRPNQMPFKMFAVPYVSTPAVATNRNTNQRSLPGEITIPARYAITAFAIRKNAMVQTRLSPMFGGPFHNVSVPRGPACIRALKASLFIASGLDAYGKQYCPGGRLSLLICRMIVSSFGSPTQSDLWCGNSIQAAQL